MKNYFIFITAMFSALTFNAQSLVHALISNGGPEGYSNFATIDPLTGSILSSTPLTSVEAIVIGSSTMDQQNGQYIFTGVNQQAEWSTFMQDVFTNELQTAPNYVSILNGLQFDMSTGHSYGLGASIIDSVLGPGGQYYEYVYQNNFVDLNINSGTAINTSPLIGIDAMVLGTSTFDPIGGEYFFIGLLSGGVSGLISIDALTGFVSQIVALDLYPNEFINELEYDIVSGTFYCLHRLDEQIHFASINSSTGEIIDLLDLSNELEAFTPDASVYHQASARFIMQTYVDSGSGILTIDAANAQILAHPTIDFNMIELEANNVSFAAAMFTGIEEFNGPTFNIFPNPANEIVNLSKSEEDGNVDYILTDNLGKRITNGSFRMNEALDTSDLNEGLYTITLFSKSSFSSQRFLIQH